MPSAAIATAVAFADDSSAREAVQPERAAWADDAKGIGIVLVVIGHVIGGLTASGIVDSPLAAAVYDFIFAFHMPLFFVVSGVFVATSLRRATFAADKARTLLYPYVVWSLLQGCVMAALGGAVNHPTTFEATILNLVVDPLGHFWFLEVLFILCLLVWLGDRTGLPSEGMLAVAVGLWVVGLVPSVASGIGGVLRSVFRNGTYFTLGLCLTDRLRQLRVERRAALALGAVTALFVVAALRNWRFDAALAPVPALLGVGGVIAASHAVGDRAPWLRQLGRWSLVIYLSHILAAAGARLVLARVGIHAPEIYLASGVAMGIGAPVLLAWLRDRGYLEILFTPPARRRTRDRRAARARIFPVTTR